MLPAVDQNRSYSQFAIAKGKEPKQMDLQEDIRATDRL
jgi:hypothetical protein